MAPDDNKIKKELEQIRAENEFNKVLKDSNLNGVPDFVDELSVKISLKAKDIDQKYVFQGKEYKHLKDMPRDVRVKYLKQKINNHNPVTKIKVVREDIAKMHKRQPKKQNYNYITEQVKESKTDKILTIVLIVLGLFLAVFGWFYLKQG